MSYMKCIKEVYVCTYIEDENYTKDMVGQQTSLEKFRKKRKLLEDIWELVIIAGKTEL